MLTGHIQQDAVMKHTATTNPQLPKQTGHRNPASTERDGTRQPSILFKAVRPSLYCLATLRCMSRVRGGRLCGAPAMANRRCRQHGGRMMLDQHSRHLHITQIVRTGLFGTNGCALNDAVVAYRTQRRLARLVDITCQRSGLDPDQGASGPSEPTLKRCMPPN